MQELRIKLKQLFYQVMLAYRCTRRRMLEVCSSRDAILLTSPLPPSYGYEFDLRVSPTRRPQRQPRAARDAAPLPRGQASLGWWCHTPGPSSSSGGISLSVVRGHKLNDSTALQQVEPLDERVILNFLRQIEPLDAARCRSHAGSWMDFRSEVFEFFGRAPFEYGASGAM
jgi:hypothetical protein